MRRFGRRDDRGPRWTHGSPVAVSLCRSVTDLEVGVARANAGVRVRRGETPAVIVPFAANVRFAAEVRRARVGRDHGDGGVGRRSALDSAARPDAGAFRRRSALRKAPRPGSAHLRRNRPTRARTEARRLARSVARAELVAEHGAPTQKYHKAGIDKKGFMNSAGARSPRCAHRSETDSSERRALTAGEPGSGGLRRLLKRGRVAPAARRGGAPVAV